MSISREDIKRFGIDFMGRLQESKNNKDVMGDKLITESDFNQYADEKEKEIEKLKEYTRHQFGCFYRKSSEPCTCGLDDLLNAETNN